MDRHTTAAGATCLLACASRRTGTSPLLPACSPQLSSSAASVCSQPHLLSLRPGLVCDAEKAKNEETTKRETISGWKELAKDGKFQRKAHSSRQHACMCTNLIQSCPTLCDSMDCSPPGSSVHGTVQQECWSRLPSFPPGDLPDPGIKLSSLVSPALASRFFTTSAKTAQKHEKQLASGAEFSPSPGDSEGMKVGKALHL